MTNRVRGKNRFGLWLVVLVVIGGLLCPAHQVDAAKNWRGYTQGTSVEGMLWEYTLVTGPDGYMTLERTVSDVIPMIPIIISVMVPPYYTFSMYMRHEHDFTPKPFSAGATGFSRDNVLWAGTGWWDNSNIEY